MRLASILHRFPIIWVVIAFAIIHSPKICEGLNFAPAAAATSGAWMWYKTMLVTRPLVTKSVTSSCIMGVSDVVCQQIVSKANPVEERSSKLDSTRTLHVAITGCLWSGPITHYWYIVLEKLYTIIAQVFNIQNAAVGLIIKLILDSTIFSSVTITGYFTMRSILEGTGLKGAGYKLKTRFLSTLFGAWRFWPLANAVNFWFVPIQFRVLYMNALSFFWTGWLTYVNSKKISLPTK